MNVENIKKVRDHLKVVEPAHFRMSSWDCGTAACIGGWTERLIDEPLSAQRLLGLTADEADDLFFMASADKHMRDVTRDDAVAVLDHLLTTGKVDWDIPIAEPVAS